MGLIWWFSRIASHMPRLTNIVLGVPLSGRFVKWLGGLAEQRTLPRYANQTFTNWFAHRDAPPAPSNAGDVLLWPEDRKSVVQGKSVSVRVDLGGCRMIKKKTILQE